MGPHTYRRSLLRRPGRQKMQTYSEPGRAAHSISIYASSPAMLNRASFIESLAIERPRKTPVFMWKTTILPTKIHRGNLRGFLLRRFGSRSAVARCAGDRFWFEDFNVILAAGDTRFSNLSTQSVSSLRHWRIYSILLTLDTCHLCWL